VAGSVKASTVAEFNGNGVWRHIAVAYGGPVDPGTSPQNCQVRVWIDAVEIAATPSFGGAGYLVAHNSPLYIGSVNALWPYGGWFVKGNIDEIGIWVGPGGGSTVGILTPAEVVLLFNDGTPIDLTLGPQNASLQHYYRCGETPGDSSTALIDVQGNINCTGYGLPTIVSETP